MKFTVDGKTYNSDNIPELADHIDAVREFARENGYDDGYSAAKQEYERAIPDDRLTEEMRLDLYRAIYGGSMEKAEDIANLMAMVDIDRDIIWQARREVRVK